MSHIDPLLMQRFWSLAAKDWLTNEWLRSALDEVERRRADPLEGPAQHALRLKMAAAGKEYIQHLLPKQGPLVVKLWNVLENQQLPCRKGRDEICTIQDLVAQTAEQVLKWRNFGKKGLAFLQQQLATAGLWLGMTPAEIEAAFRQERAGASSQS